MYSGCKTGSCSALAAVDVGYTTNSAFWLTACFLAVVGTSCTEVDLSRAQVGCTRGFDLISCACFCVFLLSWSRRHHDAYLAGSREIHTTCVCMPLTLIVPLTHPPHGCAVDGMWMFFVFMR